MTNGLRESFQDLSQQLSKNSRCIGSALVDTYSWNAQKPALVEIITHMEARDMLLIKLY